VKPSTARRVSVDDWLDVSCLERPDPAHDRNERDAVTAKTTCKAVTANRVRDGVPIYLTAAGGWSQKISDVVRVTDAARLLAAAQADPLVAISPYVIDVTVMNGLVRPVGLREEIRAFGPTA
jgi:hypothetical protein